MQERVLMDFFSVFPFKLWGQNYMYTVPLRRFSFRELNSVGIISCYLKDWYRYISDVRLLQEARKPKDL